MAYENLPRLPDPTTAPAGPGFVSINYSDNAPGLVHYLNNGGAVSVQFSGNFWTFQIGYHELTLSEADTILPFLHSVSGGFSDFYIQLPLFVNPKTGVWNVSDATKTATGSISIVAGSQDKTVQIPNWTSRGGDLSVGDMIKFTNSNKIYRIVATTLVANTKTLTLNCPIVQPERVSTAGLEPNSIKFKVRLTEGSNISSQFTTRGLYESFSINLRENIL